MDKIILFASHDETVWIHGKVLEELSGEKGRNEMVFMEREQFKKMVAEYLLAHQTERVFVEEFEWKGIAGNA